MFQIGLLIAYLANITMQKIDFSERCTADLEFQEGKLQDFLWDRGALDLGTRVSKDEKKERSIARNAISLADAWTEYLAERKAKWSARHYQNHINLSAVGGEPKKWGAGRKVGGPLAPLMQQPLTSLTGDKLARWLKAESAQRPTNAAHSFQILKAFARWTIDIPAYHGLVPTDVFTSSEVRELIPRSETSVGDSLKREQLGSWFSAVTQISNPVFSAYLQGLLLTGARRNELATLRWANIADQWGQMTLSDQVDGMRTIPLTPYFSKLIFALPRSNEWVFSSLAASSGHIVAPTRVHQSALNKANLPHVTIHGLRRTFRTLSDYAEAPPDVVAQILGCEPAAKMRKNCVRPPIEVLRMWHVKIETWILNEAGIKWDTRT